MAKMTNPFLRKLRKQQINLKNHINDNKTKKYVKTVYI